MAKICYVPRDFKLPAIYMIEDCNRIIEEFARQGFDLTLRQLYYQCVARDIIPNNVREYKNLGELVNNARLAGMIDWDHIVDRVRNLAKRSSWDDPSDIIKSAMHSYHIDYWKEQGFRPEVWIEKNALIGVIEPICSSLDIPYFACVGYTSQSEMWGAAQRLRGYIEEGKVPVIFHLGDHDPSGQDMTRDIQDRLNLFIRHDMAHLRRRFSGVEVNRVALNMDQIDQYQPPPNPAKLTDTRSVKYIELYGDDSWELDALSPTVIADIIRKSIDPLINKAIWKETKAEEKKGKDLLQEVSDNWEEVTEYLEGREGDDE